MVRWGGEATAARGLRSGGAAAQGWIGCGGDGARVLGVAAGAFKERGPEIWACVRGKGIPGDLAADLGRELARGGRKGGGDGADLWAMLVSGGASDAEREWRWRVGPGAAVRAGWR